MSIMLFVAIWQIISSSSIVDQNLFPSPYAVLLAFVDLVIHGDLANHIGVSMKRVTQGIVIGSLIGISAGLLTGRVKPIDEILGPTLHALRSFPPVAIIPLVIVWLGIGDTAKIFAISFAVFFPVWINTHIGASSIPEHFMQSAKLLSKNSLKKIFQVILPASSNHIQAGIRLGISTAFIMIFVSELAGASSGIGYLISTAHLSYRIDQMIVGILTLGCLGAACDVVFTSTVRWLCPWIRST